MTDLPKVDRLELGKYSAQTVQNRLRDDTSEAHSITIIGINRNRSGGLRLGEIRSEGEVRDEGIHSGRDVCGWVGDGWECFELFDDQRLIRFVLLYAAGAYYEHRRIQ